MSGDAAIVVRPSLPALSWFAVGLWAGVAGVESRSWSAYVSGATFGLPGFLALALILMMCATLLCRRAALALVLAGVALGCGIGALYWADWHSDITALQAAPSPQWIAEAAEDPRVGAFGPRSAVAVSEPLRTRVTCSWPNQGRPPESGDCVRFYGVPKAPGKDEYGRRAHRSGSTASVSARVVRVAGRARGPQGVVAGWRRAATKSVGDVKGPGGDLLAGVVLGDRRRLAGTTTESDFRMTGLSHLVAVSGSHLVVVAALVTWALRRARASRAATAIVVAAILGLYVLMSGVQPSAVRAWIMAMVLATAGLGGRRGDGLAALSVAACGALIVNPASAFEIGLQLSVLAVAGLLAFGRLAERWTSAALAGPFSMLAGPVALTLVAQAATIPLTVPAFGMVSLVSPLANLLVGPLISLVLSIGLAGVCVSALLPSAGRMLLALAGVVGLAAAKVAAGLSALPWAAVPAGWDGSTMGVGCVLIAALIWVAWPLPTKAKSRAALFAVCAAVVLAVVGPVRSGGPEVVVLDVGQGDAVLVRDGAKALLIDAGPSQGALREALARARVRVLDAVVLTHFHDDHTGGLAALEGLVPVRLLAVPAGGLSGSAPCLSMARRVADDVREVSAGDAFAIGRLTVTVVWPEDPVQDPATNESSVVVRVSGPGLTALLTGDAESDVLEQVVASGLAGDVDVLKVGHHGSAGAVSEDVLATLRPEYALVSVGAGNRFGHPVASTLSLLEDAGSLTLRTDLEGDLAVRRGRVGWVVAGRSRGEGHAACATLSATAAGHRAGSIGTCERRSEAGISDTERTGVARRSGADQAQGQSGRRSGSGLQHAGVHGGQRRLGRDSRCLQHHAVRLRSPPRDREVRGEAF